MARKRTTEPTQPQDARTRRSIAALQDALLALLERKSIDQISIKEISDEAGLSHPTFFRRFASKEELLQQVAANEVHNLLNLGQSAITTRSSESARDMCEYVQSHRKLWSTLLNGGARPVMREEFMRIAYEIAELRPRSNPWVPIDLAVPYVTSAIFEILAWWMRQADDYPVENVITLFDALLIEVVSREHGRKLI